MTTDENLIDPKYGDVYDAIEGYSAFRARLGEINEGDFSCFPEGTRLAQEAWVKVGPHLLCRGLGITDGKVLHSYTDGAEIPETQKARLAILIAAMDAVASVYDLETGQFFLRSAWYDGERGLIDVIATGDITELTDPSGPVMTSFAALFS